MAVAFQLAPGKRTGLWQTARPRGVRAGAIGRWCLAALVLAIALPASAQVLSPPPRLEPTAIALSEIQQCARNIKPGAPDISAQLQDAQRQLFSGLLKGGYTNQSFGGSGYGADQYKKNGDWLLVPPPKEYVEDLSHEARWCLQVAQIFNTVPEKKEAARKVLQSIADDLHIKVVDCKAWGAGRLVTIIASTVKNGQPDAGWTVMYKWVSVSGLSAAPLSFPQISTPTSKALPPGVYSVYATKDVGGKVMKTEPISVSAFQDSKVKCEIPVP